MSIEFDKGASHDKQPTVASPIEPVVSSELIEAEYAGYRGYHTHTRRQDNPYVNEKMREAWGFGYDKAYKED